MVLYRSAHRRACLRGLAHTHAFLCSICPGWKEMMPRAMLMPHVQSLWLKTAEFCSPKFWRLRVCTKGVSGWFLLEALQEYLPVCVSRQLPTGIAPLACGLHTPVSASVFMALASPCLCVPSTFLSLIRTLTVGFRAHSSLEWSHSKTWDSGKTYILGTHNSIHCKYLMEREWRVTLLWRNLINTT